MAFKQDEDFLRFITMGAAGCARVAEYLSSEHGHRMVELERYAMANKIWSTKIKRLRVPDLVCLDCGLRVEARAKSKLEIKVSDSEATGREWDAGLRGTDLIAFVRWDADTGQASSLVECFTVADMQATITSSKLGPRKSAADGAEQDRSWTARVAKVDGEVTGVDPAVQRVSTRLATGRRQSYSIPLTIPAWLYVSEGETFNGLDQFLLGAVPPPGSLDCATGWSPIAQLESLDPITRFTAVKACGLRYDVEAFERLQLIAENDADPRIALEALAGLARLEPETYTQSIAMRVDDQDTDDRASVAMAMEALFVLAELGTEAAAEELQRLASDPDLTSEQRSAAVWGLGTVGLDRPDLLIDFIADSDDEVALHALGAIGDLDDQTLAAAIRRLSHTTSPREAASVAALLAGQGAKGTAALLEATSFAEVPRLSAIVALGDLPESEVRAVGGQRLTEAVEAVLRPMWTRSESWLLSDLAETPLEFLKRQTVRYRP